MIDLKQIDMKDLNEILESESLSDFRMDFDRQISDLENHPNGMKRYIMLCLMAEMTLARIENADTYNFVEKLQKQIDALNEKHGQMREMLQAHANENVRICDQFDSYLAILDNIRRDIESRLADYDREIAGIVRMRDSLSVNQARKSGNVMS